VAILAKTYSRPIETPVRNLRPARETCEECHRPQLFHGDKLVVRNHFQPDKDNTDAKTVLLVKIGSAGDRAVSPNGIHWHVAYENQITYRTTDRERETIPEVTLHRKDGSTVVFRSSDAKKQLAGGVVETRTMDCLDCHNRPTHIYLSANNALDERMLKGEIPTDLPFIKAQALKVVKPAYATKAEGLAKIAEGLRTWYRVNQPEQPAEKVEKAIRGVQAAYADYVWPRMNIQWGTYTSHLGHTEDTGCFRCHDGDHTSDSGETISGDCDTCHTLLAMDDPDPAILKTLNGE